MIYDVAIIGAGIAGASLAAEIVGERSVLLIEAENMPGYHSTGRSAAFWSETYGGPAIQPLTSASGAFLAKPPADFSDRTLMQPRGALHLGQAQDAAAAAEMVADFTKSGVALERINEASIAARIRGVRAGWSEALWEPDCCDIDVAALHAGYLKKARQSGADLACNAPMHAAAFAAGKWTILAGKAEYAARLMVNAAGAWADEVAQMVGVKPVGITPYRRTIMQLAVEPAAEPDLPLVVGLDGSFYFKPEAGGRIWLSPHDEIESAACDAAPEEMDVALSIDRFKQVVDWDVIRVERKWAGLRSFAPDRAPVIGLDVTVPEFFWLAGQGGFGIQTAPAVAALAGALLLDRPNPLQNVNIQSYSPARFC